MSEISHRHNRLVEQENPRIVPEQRAGLISDIIPSLLLMAAVFLAYQPVWNAGFIWEDKDYIVNNPALRLWSGLGDIWFRPAAAGHQPCPLNFSLFWLYCRIWGLNATAFHLANIFWHGAGALLLWQVLKRLQVMGAWFGAALFALHPVNVMSVAWVTEQKNTLSGALLLGSMLAYLHFLDPGCDDAAKRKPRWTGYALALFLFVLAMLAKTAVCFLPVLLFLIIWWKRKDCSWRDALPLLPMLGLGIGLGLLTKRLEHDVVGAAGHSFSIGLADRILISGRSFWFYLGKVIFPHPLCFYYPRWDVSTKVWWQYVHPSATLGFFALLWVKREKWGRGLFVAAVHFYLSSSLLILLVVLFRTRYTFVSDHWMYYSGMSALPAMAALLACAARKQDLRLKTAAAGLLLTGLGVLTWQHSCTYINYETHLRATLKSNPACWVAGNNLAGLLLEKDRPTEALLYAKKSLENGPAHVEVHNNLGLIWLKLGQTEEARAAFKTALQIDPGYAEAYSNLGELDLKQGQWHEARSELEQALALNPDSVHTLYNLGLTSLKAGQTAQAISQLKKAVHLNPNFVEALATLGEAYRQSGRADLALPEYERALQISPGDTTALQGLAWLLATCADPHLRNGPRAVTLALKADDGSGGGDSVIKQTLAAAYAEAGRFDEAVVTAQKALLYAREQKNTDLQNELTGQIKLYQAGLAFHEKDLAPRN